MLCEPLAFEDTDCKLVGAVNEPLASESCAVKVQVPLGKLAAGVYVNGTLIPVAPAQNGEPLTVPVVMVPIKLKLPEKLKSFIL